MSRVAGPLRSFHVVVEYGDGTRTEFDTMSRYGKSGAESQARFTRRNQAEKHGGFQAITATAIEPQAVTP